MFRSLKMARELDIILLGATGFTGKRAIPVLAKLTKWKNRELTWGVAGRSEQKLKNVLQQCENDTGTSMNDIPIIIADIQEQKTLREMARKARIVINCCGPYRFFGEPVVKACVEEGTHHVDVTGEPEYMEKMQLKYHDKAREKGIYIISACGFDCIPADLGVVFLQQKFKGTLNSAVSYIKSWEEGEAVAGAAFNFATWESALYGLVHAKDLGELRRKLFLNRLPSFKPKLILKTRPHRSNLVEGWAVPFPGADRSVMQRTQRYFYENDKKRPVQVEPYYVFASLTNFLSAAATGSIFQMLATSEYGRSLLLKYPEKFSNGYFSREPPNDEKLNRTLFSVTLYGEGWKENLPDPTDQYSTPPDRAICAEVKGRNPGYGATCVFVVLSAITVITEPDKMPPGGGVYPPGYAFAKTSLIEELCENDVTFEVSFEKDLPTSKY